jgi:hypothetical protein
LNSIKYLAYLKQKKIEIRAKYSLLGIEGVRGRGRGQSGW